MRFHVVISFQVLLKIIVFIPQIFIQGDFVPYRPQLFPLRQSVQLICYVFLHSGDAIVRKGIYCTPEA